MSLQILINGIATGAVYALIATGFALIFNVLKFEASVVCVESHLPGRVG